VWQKDDRIRKSPLKFYIIIIVKSQEPVKHLCSKDWIIICRLWLEVLSPLDMEPDSTVRFPSTFGKISALSELSATPTNRIS